MIAQCTGWREIRIPLESKELYTFEVPFANCRYYVLSEEYYSLFDIGADCNSYTDSV